MNIGNYVSTALFISIFLLGNIFLIAFLKGNIFLIAYFIFSLFWLVAIGFILNKRYPEEIKFSFLIIIILLLALTITFFGNSIKNYYSNAESNSILDSQIKEIDDMNNYYISYVDFLNNELTNIKEGNSNTQSQIDALIAEQSLPNVPKVVPPIYLYEDDEEYEDD